MTLRIAAVAVAATFACAAAHAADNPFAGLRGKMKPGLYEYQMEMSGVPGMPPNMGKHTMQHCVTPEDIERGQVGRADKGPRGENCEVKDFNMSGNTASYKMVCQNGPTMNAKMTFREGGYTMDGDMTMPGRNGAEPMHMKQHMESKYLGPCQGMK
jgi:hypothetical protein